MAAAHRRMLSLIAEIDRRRVWRDLGARDTAHWLSIRYGVSQWKARRWIDAAHALESLPAVSRRWSPASCTWTRSPSSRGSPPPRRSRAVGVGGRRVLRGDPA